MDYKMNRVVFQEHDMDGFNVDESNSGTSATSATSGSSQDHDMSEHNVLEPQPPEEEEDGDREEGGEEGGEEGV